MTPESIHLAATWIRQLRGVLTAEEKWIRSPSFSRAEALKVVAYRRKILDAYERSLGSLAGENVG